MDEGQCGLPVEELIALAEKLLEASAELVQTTLNLELEDGAVVADDLEDCRFVFLAGLSERSRKSPRSSRRSPLESRPGPPLTLTRPSVGRAENQADAFLCMVGRVRVPSSGSRMPRYSLKPNTGDQHRPNRACR